MLGLVSFVVDNIPEHFYKAELLLFSLDKFGGVPRDNILVQCAENISPDFLAFLQARGYRYRLFPPGLDGKCCNKFQQPEDKETYPANADSINLLDIDTVALTPFGTISAPLPGTHMLDTSLASFNAALVEQGQFTFFDAWKRQQAEYIIRAAAPSQNGPLHQLFSSRKLHEQPRRRLILHAGTPKTGTTSLQHYLHEQRSMLQGHGILYPSVPEATSASVPKHQWLMDDLLTGNEAHLAAKMSAALDELKPETHTLILSTEGIFNHWWDFPPTSKALLATLPNWFNTELWVWFREPASFMKSYYLQKLCNPRTQRVRSNGIDLSMEEMLQDDWIVRHLDYLGFMRDAQAAFGSNSVSAFAYDGSTLGAALKHLGLPPPPPDKEAQRHNVSLGEMGVSLIRVANRYDLNPAEKEQVTNLIKQLDAVVAKKCGPYILDEAARACIKTYFSLQENILKQEFGLSWTGAQDKPVSPQEIAAPAQAVQIKRTRFF